MTVMQANFSSSCVFNYSYQEHFGTFHDLNYFHSTCEQRHRFPLIIFAAWTSLWVANAFQFLPSYRFHTCYVLYFVFRSSICHFFWSFCNWSKERNAALPEEKKTKQNGTVRINCCRRRKHGVYVGIQTFAYILLIHMHHPEGTTDHVNH